MAASVLSRCQDKTEIPRRQDKILLGCAMTNGTAKKAPPADHIGRLVTLRHAESPGVPLEGMEILGRARRLTLLSRPAIEAVFAKHGIDTGEFDVLATLSRTGAPYEMRPTEIMQNLLISSGGLTDRLKRLETKGLVSRRKSKGDRRSTMACLTTMGRKLIESAYAEDMAVEAEMLGSLTASERRALADLLAKLLASVE
jgi:DNA-binding MarR family transcriptional regulator